MLHLRTRRYPDREKGSVEFAFRIADGADTKEHAATATGCQKVPPISMENDMKTTLLVRLALATACALGAVSAVQAKIVAEPEMGAFCAGEAAAKLGTRPRNILTLPVEKSGGKYIVYGQSPADGADVTTFECTFGSDRKYSGIKITGRPAGGGSADNGGAPPAAMAACKGMVGVPAKVEVVSPLRPGFTEIILRENASGRRIACTATDDGSIEDWVELN
jgi:hypothetical protein